MTIDLLNPNRDDLLKKWEKELEIVQPSNKWDLAEELCYWAEYASTRNNILELGAYNGASTKIMCLANPNAKITVIDLWEDAGTHEAFLANLAPEIFDNRVTWTRDTTWRGMERLMQVGEASFDGCMIDAGHTEELVAGDIERCIPLMKPGTLLCGHDFHDAWADNGVSKAVMRLLPQWKRPLPTASIWCAQL